MAKITIEHDGNTAVDEGDLVLAFVIKPDELDEDGYTTTPVSFRICGYGSARHALKSVSVELGAAVNDLFEGQARRALVYAEMLEAFQRGFDGKDVKAADAPEKS